jgi:hypothetical protein
MPAVLERRDPTSDNQWRATMSDSDDIGARDSILQLLSDDENAKVSNAEGKPLPAGEEYVDLEDLDAGVQKASASMTAEGAATILPRSAIHDETWTKILTQLAD